LERAALEAAAMRSRLGNSDGLGRSYGAVGKPADRMRLGDLPGPAEAEMLVLAPGARDDQETIR
jgi:hypothetical protein